MRYVNAYIHKILLIIRICTNRFQLQVEFYKFRVVVAKFPESEKHNQEIPFLCNMDKIVHSSVFHTHTYICTQTYTPKIKGRLNAQLQDMQSMNVWSVHGVGLFIGWLLLQYSIIIVIIFIVAVVKVMLHFVCSFVIFYFI